MRLCERIKFMNETFHSHGKLLLTAEYLVVDGAEALAIPCKFGQDLVVSSLDTESSVKSFTLKWTSYNVEKEVWFSAHLKIKNNKVEIVHSIETETATRLQIILNEALALNPKAITENLKVETHLEFPQIWGLGSSSTLIANIAQWFDIDAFELFFATQKGSGYDIACATSKTPILYSRLNLPPSVKKVSFSPPFLDELFFVHLSQKQDSLSEVTRYENLKFDRKTEVEVFSTLTRKMLNCAKLSEFENLMELHEQRLSRILQRPTIKDSHFKDYSGTIKSLGAWGGDFILVTARPGMKEYFKNRGCKTVFSFSDMVFSFSK